MRLFSAVRCIAVGSVVVLGLQPLAHADATSEFSLESLAPLSCGQMVARLNVGLERKDPQALYSAGVIYDEGACVGRDAAQAARMMRGALDVGHPNAAAALALMTGLGEGIAQDYAAAGALLATSGVKLGHDDLARQGADADYTRGYAYTWLKVVERELKYPKDLRGSGTRGSTELLFDAGTGKWKVGTFRRLSGTDEPQIGSRIDRSRGAVAQSVEEAAQAATARVPAPDRSRVIATNYSTRLNIAPAAGDLPADIGVIPIIGNVPRARYGTGS